MLYNIPRKGLIFMADSTISFQIKKLRKSRGWTQPQLADKLSVSKQTISNWETGLKVPRMGTIQKMADLFNVNVSEIVSDQMDKALSNADALKTADLTDDDVLFTYKGKPLSDEDKELIKRLMNGKD